MASHRSTRGSSCVENGEDSQNPAIWRAPATAAWRRLARARPATRGGANAAVLPRASERLIPEQYELHDELWRPRHTQMAMLLLLGILAANSLLQTMLSRTGTTWTSQMVHP